MALQLLLLVVGFIMLIKGADWFVEGASKIADKFGIPQLVIGLTIVAMGTSAPEAAVSIASALRGEGSAGIAIGNVLGSNIMNVLVILGLTAVIRAIAVKKSTIRYEIPFTIVITVVLALLGLTDNTISRLDGGILWALMLVNLLYLLRMARKGQDVVEDVPELTEKDTPLRMVLSILLGGALIVWGADVTVDAATELALLFKMDDRLIGLTIVAFGTSLPELVTSITAALKGKADIAVGNIVGSNIFNILFVVGTAALITPVTYSASFLVDSVAAVGAMALLLVCVLPKKKLGRLGGLVMLAGYAAYFVYLIQ
ncbi:MAG: calcium/sodium antiporter [Lachnospiraceae bacterium]|nr:calcium/sodium antiporter [Lachnospiraceae bacterium]